MKITAMEELFCLTEDFLNGCLIAYRNQNPIPLTHLLWEDYTLGCSGTTPGSDVGGPGVAGEPAWASRILRPCRAPVLSGLKEVG